MPTQPPQMASTANEYIGDRLAIFIAVFTPLQVLAVALRFYARTLTERPCGVDDWLVVASLLAQLVQAGAAVAGLKLAGIGYHVKDVLATDPSALPTLFQFLIFYSAWYFITMSLSKLAICVLYHRMFPQRAISVVLGCTAAVLVATSAACLIADLAACDPFSANWGLPEVQETHCINKGALFIWSNFPNIVTDLVLLVLPMPIVWKLHTTLRLKLALTVTFFVGSMGLVAAALRFHAFYQDDGAFGDVTYTTVELLIWTLAEPGIYLISTCLLVCRPLLDKLGRRGVGPSARTDSPETYSSLDSRRTDVDYGSKEGGLVYDQGRGDNNGGTSVASHLGRRLINKRGNDRRLEAVPLHDIAIT